MKKTTFVCLSLLLLATARTYANEINNMEQTEENAYTEVDNRNSNFLSFRGTIREVVEAENGYTLFIDNDEATVLFSISSETFVIGNIEVGSDVIGFYPALAPMPLIYPPLYNISVLYVQEEDIPLIKVDLFRLMSTGDIFYDSEDDARQFVSADISLIIRVSNDTVIQDTEGNNVDFDLNGRNLVVKYTTSTRSMPAITNPELIIVLPVNPITPEVPSISDIETEPEVDWSNYPIIVDSVGLTDSFVEMNGTIYVPLRSVSVALGAEVIWNSNDNSIQIIGSGDSFSAFVYLNENLFTRDAEQIELSHPAELVNGTTYVPLSFFREVFGMNNAYFEGGHVHINNDEVMN
ncbi:MAG: copper amine oxidase N-terminal domain-containing protein [Defluviitaleaceae bacterium]|nr:copper amine oxidase N-terminal domain-containing protein [Defluviitaleaceae bacterium]